jgi:hypothetical protein
MHNAESIDVYIRVVQAIQGAYRSYKMPLQSRTIGAKLMGRKSLMYFSVSILNGLFFQFGSPSKLGVII